MRAVSTIGLLFLSNSFMTLAWYGHLKFFGTEGKNHTAVIWIILISWGIAFFEYCFQVPANRLGSSELGGPFNLWQLKVIQEVITLVVFFVFTQIFFRGASLNYNHLIAFLLLIGAVYFIFK